MKDTTEELFTAASQGDAGAVEELLVRYLPELEVYCARHAGELVRAREAAADLAQSTCREVLERLADGRFRYYWQSSAEWGLNQAPLQAPTVFNFFEPTYSQPGVVAGAGLASPELQITNETSVFGTSNFLRSVLEGYADDGAGITLDSSYLTSAGSDAVLLDRVNLLFYSGLMSTETRTIFAQALADPDFPTQPVERATTLVWLVSLSPEFVVQR